MVFWGVKWVASEWSQWTMIQTLGTTVLNNLSLNNNKSGSSWWGITRNLFVIPQVASNAFNLASYLCIIIIISKHVMVCWHAQLEEYTVTAASVSYSKMFY